MASLTGDFTIRRLSKEPTGEDTLFDTLYLRLTLLKTVKFKGLWACSLRPLNPVGRCQTIAVVMISVQPRQHHSLSTRRIQWAYQKPITLKRPDICGRPGWPHWRSDTRCRDS